MNGHVDDELRALILVSLAAESSEEPTEIRAWIDTAFNGSLVLPRQTIAALGLVQESSAEAILADGSSVELETYRCCIHWFGSVYETQVTLNDGAYALLGTILLAGRRLELDYANHTVSIE